MIAIISKWHGSACDGETASINRHANYAYPIEESESEWEDESTIDSYEHGFHWESQIDHEECSS